MGQDAIDEPEPPTDEPGTGARQLGVEHRERRRGVGPPHSAPEQRVPLAEHALVLRLRLAVTRRGLGEPSGVLVDVAEMAKGVGEEELIIVATAEGDGSKKFLDT